MPHVASPGIVHIAIESLLPAPSRIVAEDVMSLRGVNDELGPWLRMTAPRGWERQLVWSCPRAYAWGTEKATK